MLLYIEEFSLSAFNYLTAIEQNLNGTDITRLDLNLGPYFLLFYLSICSGSVQFLHIISKSNERYNIL